MRLKRAWLAVPLLFCLGGCSAQPSDVTPIPRVTTVSIAGVLPTALGTTAVGTTTVGTTATSTSSVSMPTATAPPTGTPRSTRTPAPTRTTAPTSSQLVGQPPLSSVPVTWDDLAPWLAQAWKDRSDPAKVREALALGGWQNDASQWRDVELTGDVRNEWVLQLLDIHADPEYAGMWPFAPPGNLWVIGEGGLLYSHHDGTDLLSRQPGLMPDVVGAADMTGDGLVELVVQDTDCGAHTCYGYFSVLGLTREGFRNLVVSGDSYMNAINMSYPDVQLIRKGERAVLSIHGGTIGSVGAGIVRAYTETWAWEGEDDLDGAVRWRETVWDPTTYRHHVLYEAMEAMYDGDLDRAQGLLTAVLEDPDLDVVPFMEDVPGQTEAAIAQFAGFRLVLTHLLQGDTVEAGRRATWLANAYPGAPLSLAVRRLVREWNGPQGMDALCARLQRDLEAYDAPTGPLEYMGYGNPSLTSAQLCTWGE